jgi:hypothetical protein
MESTEETKSAENNFGLAFNQEMPGKFWDF